MRQGHTSHYSSIQLDRSCNPIGSARSGNFLMDTVSRLYFRSDNGAQVNIDAGHCLMLLRSSSSLVCIGLWVLEDLLLRNTNQANTTDSQSNSCGNIYIMLIRIMFLINTKKHKASNPINRSMAIKTGIKYQTHLLPVEFKNIPIGQLFGISVPIGQYFPRGQIFPVTLSVGLAR